MITPLVVLLTKRLEGSEMGLFSGFSSGSAGVKSPELGTFASPHTLEETMALVRHGVSEQLSDPSQEDPAPLGIIEGIFITEMTPDKMVVTAGNKLNTFFSVCIELNSGGGKVVGHVYLDRPKRKVSKWIGNAMKINYGIQSALRSASVEKMRFQDF